MWVNDKNCSEMKKYVEIERTASNAKQKTNCILFERMYVICIAG